MKKQLMFLASCLVVMLFAVSVEAQISPLQDNGTKTAEPAAVQKNKQNTKVYVATNGAVQEMTVEDYENQGGIQTEPVTWADLSSDQFDAIKGKLLGPSLADDTPAYQKEEMAYYVESLIASGLLTTSAEVDQAQANLDALNQ